MSTTATAKKNKKFLILENGIWLGICVGLITIAVVSVRDMHPDCFWPKVILLGFIDAYILVALFICSLWSSKDYSHKVTKRMKAIIPYRPTFLIIFATFLITNACIFSSLYLSESEEFGKKIQTRTDAFCYSVGTITTISIVNFPPETRFGKRLVIFHTASNVVLLLGALALLMSRISVFENGEPSESEMLLSYSRKFKGKAIDRLLVPKLTGYSPVTWGKFVGIDLDGINNASIEISDIDITGTYPEIKVTVTKDTVSLNCAINIEASTIDIYRYVTPPNLLLITFERLIQNAVNCGFKEFLRSEYDTFVEYEQWIKFGFVLDEQFKGEPPTQDNFEKQSQQIITVFKLSNKFPSLETWRNYLLSTSG